MSTLPTLNELDVSGKRVLLRLDLNLPLDKGTIGDDTRLQAALPTIVALRDAGARVVICSQIVKVICSQIKMWSSAQRQKCDHLFTDILINHISSLKSS